jgi:hypothetical protein
MKQWPASPIRDMVRIFPRSTVGAEQGANSIRKTDKSRTGEPYDNQIAQKILNQIRRKDKKISKLWLRLDGPSDFSF